MHVEFTDRRGNTGTVDETFTLEYDGPYQYDANRLVTSHEQREGKEPDPRQFELEDDQYLSGEIPGEHDTETKLRLLATALRWTTKFETAEVIP